MRQIVDWLMQIDHPELQRGPTLRIPSVNRYVSVCGPALHAEAVVDLSGKMASSHLFQCTVPSQQSCPAVDSFQVELSDELVQRSHVLVDAFPSRRTSNQSQWC